MISLKTTLCEAQITLLGSLGVYPLRKILKVRCSRSEIEFGGILTKI